MGGGGGARATSPLACLLFSRMAEQGPLLLPVNSRNSPVLQNIPESLGTFPMSEYSLPIYEYLPLYHFETPRHVRDLIRDSEQTSVIKSHNS